MHARPPPWNVILKPSIVQASYTATGNVDSQMGINSRDVRFSDCLRKGRQPTLRLPFVRIGAPQRLVSVCGSDGNDNISAFRDEDLVHHRSISSFNRSRKWQDCVLRRSMTHVRNITCTDKKNFAYTLGI